MANIPVERTPSGVPWWLWLVGLLLIAGAAALLLGAFDDDDDSVETAGVPVEVIEPVDQSAAAPMQLSGLVVTRVPGDRTFFVAPTMDSADETLVILDQSATPGVPGIEGEVDINPGQTVDLSAGSLEPFGDADVLALGLPDADANALTADTQVVRINGDNVEISDAELDNVEVGEE